MNIKRSCWVRVLLSYFAVLAIPQRAADGFDLQYDHYASGNELLYHSSAGIHQRLKSLNASFVRAIPLTDSSSGHRQMLFRAVNGIAIRPSMQAKLPTVVAICNQHCREFIAAEICFWFVRLLGHDTNALWQWPEFKAAIAKTGTRGSSERALLEWVAHVTSKVKVEFVPVMDKECRDYISATGDAWQRKTIKTGVDLNRNWLVNRLPRGSTNIDEQDPESAVYHGPAALSEWQTRTIYNYMKHIRNRAFFLDIHSGMWGLITPWSGKQDFSDIPAATLSRWQALLDTMQLPFTDKSNRVGIAAGPASGISSYQSHGASIDTAYGDLRFAYVLGVETYGPDYTYNNGMGTSCPTLHNWQTLCKDVKTCGLAACSGLSTTAAIDSERAAAAALAAATEDSELDLSKDPFLKHLIGPGFGKYQLLDFNPCTQAEYRAVVSKWLVSFMLAIDHVASKSQGG